MRHPGGFEPEPCLGVLSVERSWQKRRMCAHVGDTLIVRGAARAGNASTRATKVPGNDGKIDTGRRNLGRTALLVVSRTRQRFMCNCLVDQRRGILGIYQRARTSGRVEDRGLANQITSDAGNRGDSIEVI